MTDKFLHITSDTNISNGSQPIYGASLAGKNLGINLPVATDSNRTLISRKLTIDDIENLTGDIYDQTLNTTDNVTFNAVSIVNPTTSPTLELDDPTGTGAGSSQTIIMKDQADAVVGELKQTGGDVTLSNNIPNEQLILKSGIKSIIVDEANDEVTINTANVSATVSNTTDLGKLAIRYKNLYLEGNIDTNGLVDGRDVSVDGAVLDQLALDIVERVEIVGGALTPTVLSPVVSVFGVGPNITGLAYGIPPLNRYVGVRPGTNTFIYSNDNGTTWQTTNITLGNWAHVTYNIATSEFICVPLFTQPEAYKSSDGITWTPDATYIPGAYVHISSGVTDTMALTSSSAYIYNGSWVAPPANPTFGNFKACANIGGAWVICSGTASPASIAYTNDSGASYTLMNVNFSLATYAWTDIASNDNDRVVAISPQGIAYSNDLVNWTPATIPSSRPWSQIVWSFPASHFIVLPNDTSGKALISPDGINWTEHDTTASTVGWPVMANSSISASIVAINGQEEVLRFTVGTLPAYVDPNSGSYTNLALGDETNRFSNAYVSGAMYIGNDDTSDYKLPNNRPNSNELLIGTGNRSINWATLSHNSLNDKGTNTHIDIDNHISTANAHIADVTKHRIINDAGISATELWSANKINTEFVATNSNVTTVSNTLNSHIGDVDKHRIINDAGPPSNIELYSSLKIENLVGAIPSGLTYQGTWDALSNTPTLSDGSGTHGHYYVVSNEGPTLIDGVNEWHVGDWIMASNAGPWQKLDHSDQVTSVAGKQGVVLLNTDDVTESTNLYYTEARVDANIASKTTDNLTEGVTNLYYTEARVDANISGKTTDDVAEGVTNLYYTEARVDANISGKTTDNLTEGVTNLYYTEARVDANISSKTTDNLTEGVTNLYYTEARVDANISGKTTDDVAEGVTNLYYTDARVSANTDVVNATNHISDDTKHRIINDAGISTTELWSADKINTEFVNTYLNVTTVSDNLNTHIGTTDIHRSVDQDLNTTNNVQFTGLTVSDVTGRVIIKDSNTLGENSQTELFYYDSANALQGSLQKTGDGIILNASGATNYVGLQAPFGDSAVFVEDTKVTFGKSALTSWNVPYLRGTDGQILRSDAIGNMTFQDVSGLAGSIDHSQLLNIGTNSHADIDTFIASKAQANGLASLDGMAYVPDSQISVGSVTQHEASITHASLIGVAGTTYTHTQIDSHINDLTLHRTIDDTSNTQTDLISANRASINELKTRDLEEYNERLYKVTGTATLVSGSYPQNDMTYSSYYKMFLNGAVRSFDGVTWSPMVNGVPGRLVLEDGKGNLFTVGSPNAYYSTEGLTWNIVNFSATSTRDMRNGDVNRETGRVLFIHGISPGGGTGSQVIYSDNGGLTWNGGGAGLDVARVYTVTWVSGKRWVACSSHNPAQIYESTNDGVNWVSIGTVDPSVTTYAYILSFKNVIVLTRGSLQAYISYDGGFNWSPITGQNGVCLLKLTKGRNMLVTSCTSGNVVTYSYDGNYWFIGPSVVTLTDRRGEAISEGLRDSDTDYFVYGGNGLIYRHAITYDAKPLIGNDVGSDLKRFNVVYASRLNVTDPLGSFYWPASTAITTCTDTVSFFIAVLPANPSTGFPVASAYIDQFTLDDTGNPGRLTYTGTETRLFKIDASVAISSTSKEDYVIALAKNGAIIPGSTMGVTCEVADSQFSLTTQGIITLSNNNYIDIRVKCTSGAGSQVRFLCGTLNSLVLSNPV